MRDSSWDKDKALRFWRVGFQYLHLVEIVAQEVAKQGNKSGVVSSAKVSWEQLQSETAWGDHNLIIPLLFNFYHGVEVLLKGFNKGKPSREHSILILLGNFEREYTSHKISQLLSPYMREAELVEPLKSFFLGSSVDQFYQALKYPQGGPENRPVIYNHALLMYRDMDGLPFFSRLAADVDQLRREVVTLAESLLPEGEKG